jgi:hypothetical protein
VWGVRREGVEQLIKAKLFRRRSIVGNYLEGKNAGKLVEGLPARRRIQRGVKYSARKNFVNYLSLLLFLFLFP